MKPINLTRRERQFIRSALKEWNHDRLARLVGDDREEAETDVVSDIVSEIIAKLKFAT